MPELTPDQIAEAQLRAQQDYYLQETKQLLDLSRLSRANCAMASPQSEPVRKMLYENFMACARVWFKLDVMPTPKEEETAQ